MKNISLVVFRIALIIAILVLPLIGFFVPEPQKVYASYETLTVNGEGGIATDYFSYNGGAGNYTVLNSDDGDTSYASMTARGPFPCYHDWTFTNNTTNWETINYIQYNVKVRGGDLYTLPRPDYTIYAFVRIGGINYVQTREYDASGVYTSIGFLWINNPATGSAWTADAINNATFGLQWGDDDWTLFVTYMYVSVEYTVSTVPSVTTSAASTISSNGTINFATLNGDLTSTGGATVTMEGFAWSTTSNTTTPASTQVPPATYSNYYTMNGTFSAGAFSANITTFAACTTYYYRAYAYNTKGWAWGTQQSFTTLCQPTITTVAATYVTLTSARLNATVTSAGGQQCDVRFLYSVLSGNCTAGTVCTTATCNATSYNGTTSWVENTYGDGATPYVDISSLSANTTYYFCAQVRNDYMCACGGQLTFTTSSAGGGGGTTTTNPTNLRGIPTAISVSLVWVKGTGYGNTMIRYKTSGYPTSIADGYLVYLGSDSSTSHSGLLPGTTYYYIAIGESGGIYSTGNATLMMTTIAKAATGDDQPVPLTPPTWYQAPDYTRMSNIPFYGMVNWWADTFQMDRSTLWFICALLFCVGAGIFIYLKSGGKILIGIIVVIICIGLSAFMGIMSFWFELPAILMMVGALAIGERL